MNLLIYFIILLISILSIYLFNKFLGSFGLSILMTIASVISLILSFKYITLMTINVNASTIIYIMMFSSLYLLLDNYSLENAKKTIKMNFFITIFSSILLFLMSYYQESIIDSISINMKNVFATNYRVLITYPIITILSNYLLLFFYQKMKNLYDLPFITTVTTYMVVGLVSNLFFHLGSYFNIFTLKTILELSLSNYMIGLIITVIFSLILPKIKSKKVIKWMK